MCQREGLSLQHGKFAHAAKRFKTGEESSERVRVHEKIRDGIWADEGLFHLVDSWIGADGRRNVFNSS
jgi:hypothetical protein